MSVKTLPIPSFFDRQSVDAVWRVPYQQRANDAADWRRQHRIPAAGDDSFRVSLMLVDLQNTFCVPDFELYVGGRSGRGAVDDNRRVCEFIYRNLAALTEICPTMDTHQAHQIFHNLFLVDRDGGHPAPFTTITLEDSEICRRRAAPGEINDAPERMARVQPMRFFPDLSDPPGKRMP